MKIRLDRAFGPLGRNLRHAPPIKICGGQITDLKFNIKPPLIPLALAFQIPMIPLYSRNIVAGKEIDISLIRLTQLVFQPSFAVLRKLALAGIIQQGDAV